MFASKWFAPSPLPPMNRISAKRQKSSAHSRIKHWVRTTGLESIANSAFKVSDIFDYIKTRTARHEQRWLRLGQQLLTYLEQDLGQKRNAICQDLGLSNQEDHQEVYLLLIRAFIQQLVAHYEYAGVEQ
jgi:hypothetical protein